MLYFRVSFTFQWLEFYRKAVSTMRTQLLTQRKVCSLDIQSMNCFHKERCCFSGRCFWIKDFKWGLNQVLSRGKGLFLLGCPGKASNDLCTSEIHWHHPTISMSFSGLVLCRDLSALLSSNPNLQCAARYALHVNLMRLICYIWELSLWHMS